MPGYVFLCNQGTLGECLKRSLFGYPATKRKLVEKIVTGSPVFLFNITDRTLHGVFYATAPGQLHIDRNAFGGGFAAQVSVKRSGAFPPLPESAFSDVVKYVESNRFEVELSDAQVCQLQSLFEASDAAHSNAHRPAAQNLLPSPTLRAVTEHDRASPQSLLPAANDAGIPMDMLLAGDYSAMLAAQSLLYSSAVMPNLAPSLEQLWYWAGMSNVAPLFDMSALPLQLHATGQVTGAMLHPQATIVQLTNASEQSKPPSHPATPLPWTIGPAALAASKRPTSRPTSRTSSKAAAVQLPGRTSDKACPPAALRHVPAKSRINRAAPHVAKPYEAPVTDGCDAAARTADSGAEGETQPALHTRGARQHLSSVTSRTNMQGASAHAKALSAHRKDRQATPPSSEAVALVPPVNSAVVGSCKTGHGGGKVATAGAGLQQGSAAPRSTATVHARSGVCAQAAAVASREGQSAQLGTPRPSRTLTASAALCTQPEAGPASDAAIAGCLAPRSQHGMTAARKPPRAPASRVEPDLIANTATAGGGTSVEQLRVLKRRQLSAPNPGPKRQLAAHSALWFMQVTGLAAR